MSAFLASVERSLFKCWNFLGEEAWGRRSLASRGDELGVDAKQPVVFAVVVVPKLGSVGFEADAELDGFRRIVVFRN